MPVAESGNPVARIFAPAEQGSADAIVFLVTVAPAPQADLAVGVTVAADGCELARAPDSVMIAAGESQATLTVQATVDTDGAGGCTATAALAPGSGYRVADRGRSAGTRLIAATGAANPALGARIEIEARADSVVEGDELWFTLRATPAPDSAWTVEVNWRQEGSFLTGSLPRTVTIPTSGTVSFTALTEDDRNTEAGGSVTVTIAPGNGYQAGSATVSVSDNDVDPVSGAPPGRPAGIPVVTIEAVHESVEEGTTASFKLTSSPAAPLVVQVRFSEDGSFLTTDPVKVTVLDPDGTARVRAATHDDSTDEPDGTVTATVEDLDGYVVGTPGSARTEIRDNDDPDPTVTVMATQDSVTEGEDLVFSFAATATPAAALTVALGWSDPSSVLAGAIPESVEMSSATATLTVATDDDDIDETHATVTVTVQSGTGYLVGTPSTAQASVLDNEPTIPRVTIAADYDAVDEGDPVQFTVTASPQPDATLTVTVGWSDPNTALTGTAPASVEIPVTGTGALTASTRSNATVDHDALVTATVESGTGYVVDSPSSAQAVVLDNDVRAMTRTGGGTVTWGGSNGPLIDNQVTRMRLNEGTNDNRFFLRVERGSSPSCTMEIDPSGNPGNPDDTSVNAGDIRYRFGGDFTTHNSTQSLTFDGSGDKVELSPANGDRIILDVTVSCP